MLKTKPPSEVSQFYSRHRYRRVGQHISAVPTPEKATTVFPVFLPPDVVKLKEKAARDIAARIQRLPVEVRSILAKNLKLQQLVWYMKLQES